MTAPATAFLHASELPERWCGRDRFVLLQTGFGGARTFLAAWHAWRGDPNRCARLHFIAIDPRLPTRAELAAIPRDARTAPWARQLLDAWPALTPNLHRLAFDEGRVQLLLVPGEPAAGLRETVARIDAFVISEPDESPGLLDRAPRLAKAIARLAAPNATLVANRLGKAAIESLRTAGFMGFQVDASGQHIADTASGTVSARYAPTFRPRSTVGRGARFSPPDKRVLIVGAGLAGCAAAWALAEHGWHSTVLERQPSIAIEASGNPAGLFHGIVNGQDGTHARFNRAAALEAKTAVAIAAARHSVVGSRAGLLQLVNAARSSTTKAMRALLTRLGLPETYVQALDADAASALAGLRLQRPAWFYPGGGWVQPRGLARSFLERAGAHVDLRCNVEVTELRRDGDAWQLLDAGGHVIATAHTVVLANAGGALRLIGGVWPVEKVRGQISRLRTVRAAGMPLPHLPVTGAGYLLPEVEGDLIFGATAQPGDDDPAVRLADHALNLAQLARLTPSLNAAAGIDPARLDGRTAWRWTSRDRLPLIGGVPHGLELEYSSDRDAGGEGKSESECEWPRASEVSRRLDQPRLIARQRGLFLYTALGSRGITWAALGAQVLAATITGAPSPIEASLLDAVDPARFIARKSRRAARNPED